MILPGSTTLDGDVPSLARFRLRSWSEVMNATSPSWQVEYLLSQASRAMICGQSGTMKSFIALDMALCIVTGLDFHGLKVKPGLVVYVAGEGASGVRQRVLAWCKARQVDPSILDGRFFVISDPMRLVDGEQATELVATLKAMPEPPALVISDTVAMTMGGDENSAKDMGLFLVPIQEIQALGATVLLIHHTGWGGERSRGSSTLPAALDTIIMTSLDRHGRYVKLKVQKQKDADPGAPLTLAPEVFEVDRDEDGRPITSLAFALVEGADDEGDEPGVGLTENESKALQALVVLGTATWTKWKEASNIRGDNSFNKAKESLEDAGLVSKQGKVYSINFTSLQNDSTES